MKEKEQSWETSWSYKISGRDDEGDQSNNNLALLLHLKWGVHRYVIYQFRKQNLFVLITNEATRNRFPATRRRATVSKRTHTKLFSPFLCLLFLPIQPFFIFYFFFLQIFCRVFSYAFSHLNGIQLKVHTLIGKLDCLVWTFNFMITNSYIMDTKTWSMTWLRVCDYVNIYKRTFVY